jgi:hypothetical protein
MREGHPCGNGFAREFLALFGIRKGRVPYFSKTIPLMFRGAALPAVSQDRNEGGIPMGRPNYSQNKRHKEIAKKRKKEEKQRQKEQKKLEKAAVNEDQVLGETTDM